MTLVPAKLVHKMTVRPIDGQINHLHRKKAKLAKTLANRPYCVTEGYWNQWPAIVRFSTEEAAIKRAAQFKLLDKVKVAIWKYSPEQDTWELLHG